MLGRTQDEFFGDFCAWCKTQVAGWGYDEATSKKVDELRSDAEQKIADRDYAAAAAVYEQVAALRPMDELPHKRLAGLYLSGGEKLKAIDQLKLLHLLEQRTNRYAKQAARLYRDVGDYRDAAAYALQSVYVEPYDLSAHQLLEEMCEQVGDEKGLARERRVIPVLEGWIADQHKSR